MKLVNRHRHPRRYVGSVAACGLLIGSLAACGDGDSSSEPSSETSASSESTAAPEPTESPDPAATTAETNDSTTEPAATGDDPAAVTADDISAELVAAAEEEGTVTVYTAWTNETIDQIRAAFEERYDVTIDALRLSSSAVNQRFLEEYDAGVHLVDMISTAGPELYRTYSDSFAPIDREKYPNLSLWPDEYIEPNAFLHYIGPQSINYNHDNVAEGDVPTTWSDLLDPRWDGRLALADPRSSAGTAAFFLMLTEHEGPEFLEQLAALNPTIVDSVAPAVQQAAAGEFDAVIPGNISHVVGLDTMSTEYMPYTTGFEMYTGITSEATHPAAAQLLMEYLQTREGQAATVGGEIFRVSPVFEGIEGAAPMPDTYYTANTAEGTERAEELYETLTGG